MSAVVHNQSIGVIEEQVFYSIMANSKKSKDVSNGYISTSSPKWVSLALYWIILTSLNEL